MYTTAELARRGALVIMASRDMDKTREAKEKLMSLYSEKNAAWNQTDLADPSLKEHLKAIKDEQVSYSMDRIHFRLDLRIPTEIPS